MHQAILTFAEKHKGRITGRVLEVGSLNVNGSVRDVLPITVGADMREGNGVDVVVAAEKVCEFFGPESFDSVVSTDALEHIEHWREAVQAMWDVLKPGGTLLLTMANPKKGRHAYPDDYWRMPMDMFLRMFAGNQVLGSFLSGPSMGAAVVKSEPLFLDFTPNKVK